MKTKSLLLCLLIGFSVPDISAQALQKGNIVGMHLMTLTLAPDVTMDKFLDFYLNKYIPEYEKYFQGVQLYLIKGILGENEDKVGILYVLKSSEVRDKYWPRGDVNSEFKQEALKKLQPLTDERKKLATWTEESQMDWIIL